MPPSSRDRYHGATKSPARTRSDHLWQITRSHTLAHHPPKPDQNHFVAVTILLNKPFDVVTRFTLPGNAKVGQRCLADVIDVPGVYPVGRLDRDSEGLLLLTDDTRIATRLLDPAYSHARMYLVQVEGVADPAQVTRLAEGIVLDDVRTRPAQVHLLPDEPWLWVRDPPIRHRLTVPTSWLELTLTEGRNRQVRRMTAAVGLPTLRLVRWSILGLTVAGLAPGEWRQLGSDDLDPLQHELGIGARSRPRR